VQFIAGNRRSARSRFAVSAPNWRGRKRRALASDVHVVTVALDIERLSEAATELDIQPRPRRWTHLSLCVLDAVHSVNAHYDRVTVPLCRRYAKAAKLADPVLAPQDAHIVIGTDREQPLTAFATWAANLGEEGLAAALGNWQRTRSRKDAPLKTRADIGYAQVLVAHGIETLGAATELLGDDDRRLAVEADLAGVPGHGFGARRDYLWMLAGDDAHIKPDRMVLRWITRQLGRTVDVAEARELLVATAAAMEGTTPWQLDHAVWRQQSGR
jgi:hypothetical protein